MGTSVIASSKSVLTIDIVLYTHKDQITNDPMEGINEHHITVILGYKLRTDRWSVDCIDLETRLKSPAVTGWRGG